MQSYSSMPSGGNSNLTRPASLYSIHDVSRITGIEESKIRFFEREFGDFFDFTGPDLSRRNFTDRQISILQRINQLSLERRLSAPDIRRELSSLFTRRRGSLKVVAVTSGKGGVGKTTVAVNLAVQASRQGRRTLIFDADLGLANVHVLTGISPRGSVMDVVNGKATLAQILSDGPENVKVLCGGSGMAELANLGKDMVHSLGRELEQLASAFDVIVIDTAAGISANVIHFLGLADEIVLVATPNIASILDAYGVVKVAWHCRTPGQIHLLVNQVETVEQSTAVFNNISTCTQRFLQFAPQYLGYLLRDPAMEQANQSRKPFVTLYPEAANTRLLGEAAARICRPKDDANTQGQAPDRSLARLFFGEAFQHSASN